MESSICACHNRQSAVIRGKHRCVVSGHRIAVHGVPPRQTREQPFWTWPGELIDRVRARKR